MNFIAMAMLKWENISHGRLQYESAKTGKLYSIALLPPVKEILDYYKIYNAGNDYVFPILHSSRHESMYSISLRIQKCRKILNGDLKVTAKDGRDHKEHHYLCCPSLLGNDPKEKWCIDLHHQRGARSPDRKDYADLPRQL